MTAFLELLSPDDPIRITGVVVAPARIFCPVCGYQMLPGREWMAGGLPERLCALCAIWTRRYRLGIQPAIPQNIPGGGA